MNLARNIQLRVTALVLAGLVALGAGAAIAATRSTSTTPIGSGVVIIRTNLAYEGSSAAGTGMVVTSNGEILTNNHVIAGATAITVQIPKTSRTYTARVVGYDVADDVAVLQLKNASNLKTITAATSKAVVGQRVTALGNAGGTGALLAASGAVTGIDKTIVASDEQGNSEQLTGLIETDAAVQPGDSGGPLLDAAGRVLGMDTAGSTDFQFDNGGGATDAYAIPIGRALTIAKQIVAGRSSPTVHVGATAFLGVSIASGPDGATIAAVVSNGPAAKAGLVPGDVVTAIGGTSVSGPSDVQRIVLAQKPGAKVRIVYVDELGTTHTTTVTLGVGPAQ